MIRSRLRPLIGLFALLGLGLIARLFQVQIHEHAVWANEAARLVLKGREQPYRRGRILDGSGRMLARDEEVRTVDFVYREFRRDHPLGQVTHARSLLLGRPVSLVDTSLHLVDWALELVALGPHEVRAFARGESETWSARDLDRRQRARRALDFLYYLRTLLAFDLESRASREQWKRMSELCEREGERRSFLELAALVRGGEGPAGVEREREALRERLTRSLDRLGVLARWIRPDTSDSLVALVTDLERERRSVEDACAAKLFAEATGFVPGRLESDTLLECFDHGWITALLGWDGARLAEWATLVRSRWKASWRDAECIPSLYGILAFDPGMQQDAGEFLARLAVVYQPEGALREALFQGPTPWREIRELAVFDGLEDMFEADVPASALALAEAALPTQLPELRADPDDTRLLPPGTGPESFRARLEACLPVRGRRDVARLVELAGELNPVWELRFQETLRRALDTIRHTADRSELGPGGGLILAAAGRDRAAERAEFFLKDYGSRPRSLTSGEPTYDVVYLLTRFELDFPGFRVRDLETRTSVEVPGDDLHPAENLVGHVSAPTLDDLLRQQRKAARLRELKAIPEHEEEELEEMRRLIGEVRLPEEPKGVQGVEAFLEPELTGTNGWALARGAADIFGADGDEISVREPLDGQDVVLTLDSALQAAVQRCLRDPSPEHEDAAWRANPVGAVVLLSREGDVLAAASEPDDQSRVDELAAEGQRLFRTERTLRKPTFQPPGSVFKVFVASWALDHGLDPHRTVTCGPIERGGYGYKTIRCWSPYGHGVVDLHSALVQSCNAYFAWLGESLSTEDFVELCERFGFGQPTGVRRAPPWASPLVPRSGLLEDLAGLSLPSGGGELPADLRRMAGNGLGRIEATPMQLARGILSLARGEKTELRFVQRIGEREFPLGSRVPLDLSPRALEFVRQAMRGVAEEAHGTARNALSIEQLGFPVAVKTGSADLENRKDREGHTVVRKHAWVAGWAPADEPELVFVIFEHDTMSTSSHGAVFLAREVLRQPEVLLWLADHGVDVSGVRAR